MTWKHPQQDEELLTVFLPNDENQFLEMVSLLSLSWIYMWEAKLQNKKKALKKCLSLSLLPIFMISDMYSVFYLNLSN